MADLAVMIVEAVLQLSMTIMVGLYFIFSNTIMLVLSRHSDGASTMIKINKQILNPLFLICFCVSGLAGIYFFAFHTGAHAIAGLVFFVGTTLVTAFFNVPLNNSLRDAPKESVNQVWKTYLTRWVYWNHLRTLSAVVSGFMLFV